MLRQLPAGPPIRLWLRTGSALLGKICGRHGRLYRREIVEAVSGCRPRRSE